MVTRKIVSIQHEDLQIYFDILYHLGPFSWIYCTHFLRSKIETKYCFMKIVHFEENKFKTTLKLHEVHTAEYAF